jgi:hypothetical protein
MIVRCFWRNCSFQKKLQNAGLVEAFWVESTKKEADSCIFPLLQPSQVEKSKRLALEFKTVAADMGNPNHPFCFLVARDLSYIEPLEPHTQSINSGTPIPLLKACRKLPSTISNLSEP